MTNKRLLAILLIGAIVTTMLMGCSGNKETGDSGSGTELTIWTKLPEQEVPVLRDAADKWAKETGNKVNVVRDDGDFQAFLQAANSTKGPDIYFGSAHNQLAAYQQAGILTEVPAKYIKKDEYASQNVWNAVSVDNKEYAIPVSVETTALFYNKDLVKEAPKTMDDLVNEALKQGDGAFQFNINDQYTDLGFLLTNGGYIFGKNDGKYDINDLGLNNEGAVKGLQLLQDFVVKDKFMPADISGDIALTNFKEGKSLFYISGPWDIQGLKDVGINFGVSKIPAIDGQEFKPMSGVQCAFVSAKSQNIDLSWECLDYLVRETQVGLYEKGKIPVTKAMLDKEEVKDNEYVLGFLESAKNAEPMPNIKAMDAVWEPLKNIQRVLQGENPQEVANEIVSGVEKGIELQKQ